MIEIAPTHRCPFCQEVVRAHAGGAPLKNETKDDYFCETDFTYKCPKGHRFQVRQMVVGEANPIDDAPLDELQPETATA